MRKDYEFGDGSTTPLFMTNATTEATHDYLEGLFDKYNLPCGRFDGDFYPLTKEEQKFIAEDAVDAAAGTAALIGYSALYDGKKYYAPTIEIPVNEEGGETVSIVSDFAHRYTAELSQKAVLFGGMAYVDTETAPPNEINVTLLIPVSYPSQVATNLDEWKQELSKILASDLEMVPQATLKL